MHIPGYEVVAELGRGGMGVVYKAKHSALGRVVALKMILSGGHASESDLARFKTEAEAVARLQHPGIVQIHEVGEQQGLPYLSLEFCSRGSLADTLEGTPLPAREAASLLEKLARAMHAAHEKGVIHRDLKPANVLIAEDGTPKISDFGLAKKLDEEGKTATGAVMGTPSYMAPEQAKGDRVGPGTDVYALGAILYECLTGRPPFKAATAVETIRQVLATEPVAPTRLQPTTPRDLETICLKCLEKEPRRRYETAQALAEDLGRFLRNEPVLARPLGRLTRGWRWCCRNRGLASLAAALLLVLLGGVTGMTVLWLQANAQRRAAEQERDHTQAERMRADRNFAATRKAVNSYLQQIVDNKQLTEGNFHTLRKELLETSVPIFEELVQQQSDDDELEYERARTYLRLAEIRLQLGEHEKAIKDHEQAGDILARLAASHPDRPEYLNELAQCQNNRGKSLFHLNRPRECLAVFLEIRKLRVQLAKKYPSNPEYRKREAIAYNNVGVLCEKLGQLTDAETAFRRACGLHEAMVGAFPDDLAFQVELVRARANLCDLLATMGRRGGAEAVARKACDLMEAVVEQAPDKAEYRDLLVRSLLTSGHLHTLRGRPDLARDELTKAIARAKALSEDYPDIPEYAKYHGIGLRYLGLVFEGLGEWPQARDQHRQALASFARLAEHFPGAPSYRQELARAKTDLGAALTQLDQQTDATEAFRAALEIQHRLILDYPDGMEYREDLVETLCEQGLHLLKNHHIDDAGSAFQEAFRAQERLTASFSANPAYRHRLARILLLRGTWQRHRGRLADAQNDLHASLRLFGDLVAEYGEVLENEVGRAAVVNEQAVLLREQGDPKAALQKHDEAIESLKKLATASLRPPRLGRVLQTALKDRAATQERLER